MSRSLFSIPWGVALASILSVTACSLSSPLELTAADMGMFSRDMTVVPETCSEDGVVCDDGDPCTEGDICTDGACVGAPKVCTAEGQCDRAQCNPLTGACELRWAPDGEACDDGDLCTRTDTCRGGVCFGDDRLECSAGSSCVVGSCNPATGECEGTNVPDNTACENACVANGRCRRGECIGSQVLCTSDDPCRDALECDPVVGCRTELAEDGRACDDDDACTVGDACQSGRCLGEVLSCDPPGPCFVPSCDSGVGCVFDPIEDGTPCDDGNECTLKTECKSGRCEVILEVSCEVRPCMTTNTCNPATGMCTASYRPDGAKCDDGNLCTEGSTCLFRECRGGTEIPWSGTPCSEGICFTDVTSAAGITWRPISGGFHTHAASGALVDFDGDGLLDVLIGSELDRFALYANQGNGQFNDVTAGTGVLATFTSTSVHQGFTVADFDGDRDLDIFVANDGPNALLRNDGNFQFTDVTQSAGLAGSSDWSVGASWGDYDADGDLDLYVGNYITRGRRFPNHQGRWNILYRNDGNGTFTDVTQSAGLRASMLVPGATLVSTFTDFDDDGDLDILECNDFGSEVTPNELYRNDGASGFTPVGGAVGADVALYCMGIAVGDFDRDQDLDYYFTSIGRSAFLENLGGTFMDVVGPYGVELAQDDCIPAKKRANWGSGFFDFDQDGWEDLFVTGGWLRAAPALSNAQQTTNKVFRNRGPGNVMDDVSQSAGLQSKRISRGVTFGDIDNDGDVDALVINMQGAPELLRNDSPNQGRHLIVGLDGRSSNRFGLHAKVYAEGGNVTQMRELGVSPSYTCGAEPTAHFGMGSDTVLDRLRIEWPSGALQRILQVGTNQRLELTEPIVRVESLTGASTARAGDAVVVTVDLEEQLGRGGSVDLVVEVWDASNMVVVDDTVSVTLASLASVTRQITLNLPSSLSAGGYRVVASAVDASAIDQVASDLTVTP